MAKTLVSFMEGLEKRNPGETEFHQAVLEVAETIFPFISGNKEYQDARILERIAEPDRIFTFRVCWEDDQGNIRVNRGWRVQNNNAIGPYKGGLRFHSSVNQSILKFLAFEQTFKNSLTGLPMGGGKGGANFNPKGKSNNEVMRFCQAFMRELSHYIGKDMDVPAGDIGVGAREIGYMFGEYKRLSHQFEGVLTGKGLEFGGSLMRSEATGYGTVLMLNSMLETKGDDLEGKTVSVSGSGNVATYATEKATALGAKVITLSDSSGFIHDPDGIDSERLAYVMHLKNVKRDRISEYAREYKSARFVANSRPWSVPCDVALPCATENEISEEEAKTLIRNGCKAVSEGANMPTVIGGVHVFQKAGILYAPGKAANAGGVAVSGLEMSQNSGRISWSSQEVEKLLTQIMSQIHDQCVEYGGKPDGSIDYVKGANIAGFVKVADAMLAYGII